jgi:hypothetical protein
MLRPISGDADALDGFVNRGFEENMEAALRRELKAKACVELVPCELNGLTVTGYKQRFEVGHLVLLGAA